MAPRVPALLCLAALQVQAFGPSAHLLRLTALDTLQPAAIFGVGDVVAQNLHLATSSSRSKLQLEPRRLSSSMGIGAIYGGVLVRFVYAYAESLFPGFSVRNTLLKSCVSISVLSSGGNWLSMFLRRFLPGGAFSPWTHVDGAAEEGGQSSWKARWCRCATSVNADFFAVVSHDLKIWPIFDVCCYSVVPPASRPTAVALMSVCWHTYISVISSRAGGDEPAPVLALVGHGMRA